MDGDLAKHYPFYLQVKNWIKIVPLGDISRPERSHPAEGYPAAHQDEQQRIVEEALSS